MLGRRARTLCEDDRGKSGGEGEGAYKSGWGSGAKQNERSSRWRVGRGGEWADTGGHLDNY